MLTAQLAIQKLLQDRLVASQKANPRFALRSYSKKVGVHFAALSAILNGKRNVSRKLAVRIAERLGLDPQERAELISLFPAPKTERMSAGPLPRGEVLEPKYLELNAQQFKIAAEWEHFAILSLMQCQAFRSESAWISERLNITEDKARRTIERLIDLQLVSMDESGNLKRSDKNYRTPDDFASMALKKSHEQTQELARESLYRDSVETRDFTAVTVAVNPQNLSTAKEMIRKFQDELCDQLEVGERTEVYRLSVQLFPLSKLKSGSAV